MQTAYVAGGAGFIGSHLCRKLLKDGYSVVCIDNLLTSSKSNIAELVVLPHFSFLQKDVITLSPEDVKDVPKPDFIFHLASPASPNKNSATSFIAYPIETLQVNSVGTKNLLDIAKAHNARFVMASTSEVYGDPKLTPQKEDYFGNVNPNGVRSVYDEAKRFAEAITMAYVRKFGVDGRIARIFNTYGPNMQKDDGRVVSNFIVQALEEKPITLYGDGMQTRSFCYVSDLVEGLCSLMFFPGLAGEVVNIGNPNEKKIIEFATLIKELIPTSSEIVYSEPMPENDPSNRCPDIEKAKRVLHWEPRVDLEEGLKKTVEYFKKTL